MSVAEMNVYCVGEKDFDIDSSHHTKYEDYALHQYGDFVFQKSTSKNMDQLWAHFHSKQNYPEFYLGVAKKMAICKCPQTGLEEWYNRDRCLTVSKPVVGSTITVNYKVKNSVYCRDFVFMGWTKTQVHEWTMQKGSTLQLEQRFVDGLLPQDRRYLRINT